MRAYGLLGCGILDSRFSAEIEIREVPDSLAAGYGSELLRCIDEDSRLPHFRPDLPEITKISPKSMIIHNAETMASLSAALIEGTEKSCGTKVVSLVGSAVHQHTAEVEFGATIRSIIDGIGGGVSNMGELLFEPIRQSASEHEFVSSVGHYEIVPCELKESIVLVGAILLAKPLVLK